MMKSMSSDRNFAGGGNSINHSSTKKQFSQVFLKDLLVNSKDYLDIARKMADLYDEMVKKAQFFRPTTAKIFEGVGGFRYI